MTLCLRNLRTGSGKQKYGFTSAFNGDTLLCSRSGRFTLRVPIWQGNELQSSGRGGVAKNESAFEPVVTELFRMICEHSVDFQQGYDIQLISSKIFERLLRIDIGKEIYTEQIMNV